MRSDLITVLDRSFETIKLLIKKPTTTKELQERLCCSHSQAWKYIQAASLALPVIEHAERPVRFEIPKDFKF